jgi:hypothetical protein
MVPKGFKLMPEQDQESDSNIEFTEVINSKPEIKIYKGLDNKVLIENWFKRFETDY